MEHVFVSLCLSLTNEPSLSFPPHVCAHSAIPAKRSGGNEPRSGVCQSKSAVSGDPYAVGARWVGVGNDGLRVMMLNVCGMLGKQPECFCGTSVGIQNWLGLRMPTSTCKWGQQTAGRVTDRRYQLGPFRAALISPRSNPLALYISHFRRPGVGLVMTWRPKPTSPSP